MATPRYIGAPIEKVRVWIDKGPASFTMTREDYIDVRGVEAMPFTVDLQETLINKWWDAGPETKIVIGWVHSDALTKSEGDPEQPYRVVTTTVVRPRPTRRWKQPNSYEDLRTLFIFKLEESVRAVDDRLRSIESSYRVEKRDGGGRSFKKHILVPEFNRGDGYISGTSYFFVWPTNT